MRSAFLGQAYVARSKNLACDRLVGLYPESASEGADVGALLGTPGKVQLFEAGDGPIRGVYSFFNVTLFFVSGEELYYVDALSDTPALIGTIEGSERVSMVANQESKLFIVAAPKAYVYDLLTSTLSEVSLVTMGGTCDFISSFWIFEEAATSSFYIYDGISFDPLDFGTAEGLPDHILAVLVDHNEAWLFGDLGTEVWAFTGNGDFPLERIPGALIPQGCAAKFTPCRLDNSVFWLGRNESGHGVVWRANGYTPVRVSTYAVEEAIRTYGADLSDAFAYTYQQGGHSFYVLTFPSARDGLGATWVFDAATNLWHERTSFDPEFQQEGRDRGNCGTYFQGEIVVGDSRSGRVFKLDLDCFVDGNYGPIVSFEPFNLSETSETENTQLAGTAIVAGGTGFNRLDVLTLSGGEYARPARVMVVNAASNSAVTCLAVIDAGDYATVPSNPVTLIGAAGTGCTVNAYWTTSDQTVIRQESGAGYGIGAPTLTISGAVATSSCQLVGTIPSIFGTNYVVGDTLTLAGGTVTTAATIKVLAVDEAGTPTAYAIVNPGRYAVPPTNFITLTGGSGSGAVMIGHWGMGAWTLVSSATEYPEPPTVTITGGGIGAELMAVVDSSENYLAAERTFPAIPQGVNDYKRTMQHGFTLYCQSGVGNSVLPGNDPQIVLQWSDDNGHTWSNEHARDLGAIGATGHRVFWRRLGSTEKLRSRVYKVRVTDPVMRAFIGGDFDIARAAS